VNARLLIVTNDDETNVDMCCVDVHLLLFASRLS
jgi:hypothetical protein